MPPVTLLHFRLLKERGVRRCFLVAVTALLGLLAMSAQAKDDNRFVLHNASDFPIMSFMTQEPGEGWSPNWIQGERIMPGETFEMEFFADGRCEVRVRVLSSDRYVHDYLMDFCRAREIFIENNRVSYR